VPDGAVVPSIDNRATLAQPGELLRCVVAKRFSGQTILWYMSKEVITTSEREDETRVEHTFSFWARLMTMSDGSLEEMEYPSQTSGLSRNEENGGWRSLETTPAIHPPVVELLV